MNVAEVRSLAHEIEEMVGLVEGLLTAVEAEGAAAHGREVEALTVALRARLANADLPALLLRSYAEISEALGGIRLSREAIEATALDRIHRGQARLDEVSSTTESAVMELMNGIDRAVAHVEMLEREANAAGTSSEALRANIEPLRDELNQLFGFLQFQDITAQQLQGVAELLKDAEQRIGAVAKLFDPTATEFGGGRVPDRAAYNPDATMRDVESRQALADDMLRAATA